MAGVRVPVRTAADAIRYAHRAVTDREGTFVLEGLPPQPVPIRLSRPRYQVQTESDPRRSRRGRADLPPPARRGGPAPGRADRGRADPAGTAPTADVRRPHAVRDQLPRRWARRAERRQQSRPRAARHRTSWRDTYFRIGEKMVQVRGTSKPNMPVSVTGIKVAARGKKLHILHATQQQAELGTELGDYVIHYADGSQEKIPIVYGRNLSTGGISRRRRTIRPRPRSPGRGAMMLDRAERTRARRSASSPSPGPTRTRTRRSPRSTSYRPCRRCDPYLVAVTVEREK